MRRFNTLVAALIVSCSLLPATARAEADGCIALGTHAGGAQCTYIASGPGIWLATTPNPFLISYSDDGGITKHNLVQRSAAGADFAEGILVTQPGWRVYVSITCWDWSHMNQTCSALGGRDGAVTAQSQL